MGTWVDNDTFETTEWPYVEAANYGVRRTAPVRGEVLHTPQTGEGANTARGVANYFASGQTQGSTHTSVDSDEIIQCVYDSFVCHGAPGANHDRLHVEMAGRAEQTREQWLDPYSRGVIRQAADVTAQHALKYGFPIRRLSVQELRLGAKGVCDHADVRDAFGRTDHWDVGDGFPWDIFLDEANDRHHYWLTQHPGYNPAEDEPDFKVVVFASGDPGADVDEGMARVYAKRNALKFLEWPIKGTSFGSAIVVGAAARYAEQIKAASMAEVVHVIAGADRDETAAKVEAEMAKGQRTLKFIDY